MGQRILFDRKPDGSEIWFEDTEKGFILDYHQDCQDIVDHNKALQTSDDGHTKINDDRDSPEMRHVASIPNIFVVKFLEEYGINVYEEEHWNDGTIPRLLNDPDYRFLKTRDEKI